MNKTTRDFLLQSINIKNSGTRLSRRTNSVIPYRKSRTANSQNIYNLRQSQPSYDNNRVTESYSSAYDMVCGKRPSVPVHCVRHDVISNISSWFVTNFPGEVMFAVKTNPDVSVLRTIRKAGIKNFDVASLAEIQTVADNIENAKMYFMHPVKSREAIFAAYFNYGIRDFSLDCHAELQKILEVTNYAEDLSLHVRLSIANDKALFSLAGKFGVNLEEATSLIVAAHKASKKLGICFHVGSQCMNPDAYEYAIRLVNDLLIQTEVKLDMLDVGGGFPSIYPEMTPPPLIDYMAMIENTVKSYSRLSSCKVLCEPGRALVAESGSVVVRVELRKGNMLYINDGTYGSLFDAGTPAFNYPVKAIRPAGKLSGDLEGFGFYGPTCDSVDVMKGPFYLPSDIKEGDWIEIGQLGAYSATMRTNFNGFYNHETVCLEDKPMLSIFSVN
ncbi:MAG: type III PLP-dependent enzyme [Rickettsiales bacterium]